MQFQVHYQDGSISDPLEQSDVLHLVSLDRIFPDTQMKNAMMPAWQRAAEFAFLKDAFQAQSARLGLHEKTAATGNAPSTTSFKNYLDPVRPGLVLRLSAALQDLLAVFIAGCVIFGGATLILYFSAEVETPKKTEEQIQQEELAKKKAAKEAKKSDSADAGNKENKEKEKTPPPKPLMEIGTVRENSSGQKQICLYSNAESIRWTSDHSVQLAILWSVPVFLLFLLLYLTLPLGLYAQTRGMRYWGIFLSAPGKEKGMLAEVCFFRAFCFVILSILTAPLMPYYALVKKPTPAEQICGVNLYKIAAKAKN